MVAALMLAVLAQPVDVAITVQGEAVARVPERFFGTHYDGPRHKFWDALLGREVLSQESTFTSPSGRRWLSEAGVQVARLFVDIQAVHPEPGQWELGPTEAIVEDIRAAGMEPMACLNQRGGEWFVGDAKEPWWKDQRGLEEWRAASRRLAQALKGKCGRFEILNEPNHIHPDQDHYMGWDTSVALFRLAAQEIKAVIPDATCGVPASWAAWETAEWAGRALEDGRAAPLLDFVSYHIYTSHNLDDSDQAICAKMRWFEDTPTYIKGKLKALTERPIQALLTECNVSAVCFKDGKPYQDPRNTSAFGGVWMASALLHSALGGCDQAIHFSTLGGLGIIRWPPEWAPQPCYWVLPMLRNAAGLKPGAQMLDTRSSEEPVEVSQVVQGKSKDYGLEAFAVGSEDGLAVVLVNKRSDRTYRATVVAPKKPTAAELYRYTTERTADAPYRDGRVEPTQGGLVVECRPYSVTVLAWR